MGLQNSMPSATAWFMETQTCDKSTDASSADASDFQKLLDQYSCGPVRFTGTNDALYERHLVFDNVMEPTSIGARERFEAAARSVCVILSQRWLRTEEAGEEHFFLFGLTQKRNNL